MRWTATQWIRVGLLLALVLAGVWLFRPKGPGWGYGCGISARVIEVRGRLIRAGDGAPLTGVCVWTLSYEGEKAGLAEDLKWRRPFVESIPHMPAEQREAYVVAHSAISGPDGRFRISYWQEDCNCGPAGAVPEPTWRERDQLYAIAVERPGGTPWVLKPPPHGTWLSKSAVPPGELGPDSEAVWDIGEVVVPDP